MFKAKLGLFLAAAAFSLSAHAGFVQYNFSGVTLEDGGGLSGYFVQNTDNKAIAYFEISVFDGVLGGAQFFPSGITSNVSSASTYFLGAGPTNFGAFNDQDVAVHYLSVEFGSMVDAGKYRVYGNNSTSSSLPEIPSGSRAITGGYVTEGAIDPLLLASLESGPFPGINTIIPQYVGDPAAVPEPSSVALFILGLTGVFGRRLLVKKGACGQDVR